MKEVFVFDSKSENRDKEVEAVEPVSAPLDAPWGVGRKGEGERPRVPGPVLYSDTAVDRGR